MKVKYIGESFYYGFGLTNNKIYECVDIANEEECLEIIDDDDDVFLYFLSSKYISERPDFLINYNTEYHSWVIAELEKRKNDNLGILKEYELISE